MGLLLIKSSHLGRGGMEFELVNNAENAVPRLTRCLVIGDGIHGSSAVSTPQTPSDLTNLGCKIIFWLWKRKPGRICTVVTSGKNPIGGHEISILSRPKKQLQGPMDGPAQFLTSIASQRRCHYFIIYLGKARTKAPLFSQVNAILMMNLIIISLKMKTSSLRLPLLLVVVLLSTASGLSTYNFMYNNTAESPAKKAAYPLGTLSNGTSLQVNINIWNSLTDLSTVTLRLLEAITMVEVTSQACTASMSCQAVFYITTTQAYYIKVSQVIPASFAVIEPYYLVAKTFPGNTTFAGNPNEVVLLKLADVLRFNFIGKYLYSSKAQNMNFSLYPLATAVTPLAAFYLMPTNANFEIDPLVHATMTQVSFTGEVLTLTAPVEKGYYILAVTYITPTPYQQISWQSDPYACPHDPNYVDFYGVVTGCSSTKASPGLPCVSYNNITQLCTQCISGYVLNASAGTCAANTTCPDRQFYHFGQCMNVSPNCGTYDPFTGTCLTCADLANFDLTNGTCLHKTVNCTDRQWQTNYTCFDVSPACGNFDPATGKCLTCTDPLSQLTEGNCIHKDLECPQGQYAVGLTCVIIPVECVNFDTVRGVCLGCVQGYFVENGVCQRVVCPSGQAPSRFGLFCIDVSPQCATFDPLNGNCLSCKELNHVILPDGSCTQFNSPLAGCNERQRLGFGKCENADKDCKAYNLVTGNCDKCENGFYLDYTGHCKQAAVCGASQWSANGECLSFPENCLEVNQIGLCKRCVNANYRLEQGQCIFFKTCQNNQYLNALGECVDVSSSCALFNPSNGQCITCKTADTQPSFGVCCPAGQVFNRIACVDATAWLIANQDATGSGCLLFHPATGNCLSCPAGYIPDLTLGCVAE